MTQPQLTVCIYGASGRMGSRIIELALEDSTLRIVGAFTRESSSALGREISLDKNTKIPLEKTVFSTTRDCRAIIDFSSDDGARYGIEHAKKFRAALVIGTTALSVTTMHALKELSTLAPVLVAPNTSLGVALLASTVARAARALGPSYRCSIVEAHHEKKKDAPSGTAIHLAKAARDAGASLDDANIVAIRSGDVVGEHTVRFAGPGEYLEFTHRATSRDVFARGAIHAAKWLAAQPAGWYTMRDMLSITE